MAEFIAFVSGMVTMLIVWFWSSNDDRRQYRIGYRDGRFDEAEHQAEQTKGSGGIINWIPVTERLPDSDSNSNEYYLVTIQCEHVDGWDDYVTSFAEWTKHGWDTLSCYLGEIKVVAWCELPESYAQHESEVTE